MCQLFFYILALCYGLTAIAIEIHLPAFPQMARDFNINPGTIQWMMTLYYISTFMVRFISGPLCDWLGVRTILLWALGFSIGGQCVCFFSYDLIFFFIGRFIQCMGYGLIWVINAYSIATYFESEKERASWLAFSQAFFRMGLGIAPILSSLALVYAHWRYSFALVTFLMGFFWIYFYRTTPCNDSTINNEKPSWKKIIGDYKSLLSSKTFVILSFIPGIKLGIYATFISKFPFIRDQFHIPHHVYALMHAAPLLIMVITSLSYHTVSKYVSLHTTIRCGWIIEIITFTVGCLMMIGNFDVTPMMLVGWMCIYAISMSLFSPILFSHSFTLFPHQKGMVAACYSAFNNLALSFISPLSGYLVYNISSLLNVVFFYFLILLMLWIALSRYDFEFFNKKE
jgi:MFS family permease